MYNDYKTERDTLNIYFQKYLAGDNASFVKYPKIQDNAAYIERCY